MANPISLDSIVEAAKDQVSSDVAGETVILNLKNGMYYGLDPIGTAVWERMQQPQRVSEIRDALLREFDVEQDRCEHDILALLQRLADEQLVTVSDATGA
jgi:hypothetical protein